MSRKAKNAPPVVIRPEGRTETADPAGDDFGNLIKLPHIGEGARQVLYLARIATLLHDYTAEVLGSDDQLIPPANFTAGGKNEKAIMEHLEAAKALLWAEVAHIVSAEDFSQSEVTQD